MYIVQVSIKAAGQISSAQILFLCGPDPGPWWGVSGKLRTLGPGCMRALAWALSVQLGARPCGGASGP